MAANLLAERFARGDAAPDDALRYYRQAAMAGQLPTRYNIGFLGTGVEVQELFMGKKWDSNKVRQLRATGLYDFRKQNMDNSTIQVCFGV